VELDQTPPIDGSKAIRQVQSYWLSSLLHELGGPLQVARGYARLILEDREGQLTTTQRRYLDAVLENIAKLGILSRELRDFPFEDTLALDLVSIRMVLHKAVLGASASSPQNTVRIVEDGAEGALLVLGDPNQLGRSLLDLFSAAAEFAGPGGIIELCTREETEKIVFRISAAAPSNSPNKRPNAELINACRTWRLHGGSASVDQRDGFFVECELPRFRSFECSEVASAYR
jgi:signal transduction histidine kinase